MQDYKRRKFFIQGSLLSSSVLLMNGCTLFGITTPIKTFKVLQNDLFPKAKELGIDTSRYMFIIVNHSRISTQEKLFIKNGIKWLNEESIKIHNDIYTKLSPDKRHEILQIITKERWGKRWLHKIMGYLFESLLGNPMYGGNKDTKAWEWLSYEGGKPYPKEIYL